MKKKLLFYCFLPLFFLLGLTISGKAQLLLEENFDYPVDDSLGAHGWKTHSGGTTNTVKVVSASITYPGYLSSGIGGEVSLLASGADVNRIITPQSTGSIYVSFILNIKTATTTGDYFFHFGQTVMGTTFKGKLFVKSNASNKIAFGTSFGANAGNYTTFDYDLNTAYLVVLKYSLNSGSSTDDQISVFINPVLGNAEPAPTVSNNDVPAEIASVGSIALRQGSSSNAPTLLIDGIRVGLTWADVNPAAADVTAPTFTATPTQGDFDVAINAPIVLTFDEAIRNIDNSEITDANVAALLTLKETDATGADVPFTATIDVDKKIITVTPTAAFANSMVYYAAIAPVEDLSGNATVLSSMTFTTVASTTPLIGDVAITETGPYYAGSPVTITWTSSNVTDVLIEAWIPSEDKWDALFPQTPSDGTETFTIPADAQYSAEYKLRISDIANPTLIAESAIFTVIAVVNDLASLRAQPIDAIVKYTGIATVTYSRTARNQKYIQDATAAVLIDDQSAFISGTYNIGDGITNVVGKILFFNTTLLEFTPQFATGEPATGSVIIPEVRTLASITPADQCKLVKIEDFAFKTPTQYSTEGKFVVSKSYDIDGVDKAVMVYRTAFAESDYIGGYVPVGPISSIVLIGQFYEVLQFTARSWSDMTIPTSIAVTSPVGGESFVQGSTQTISWTATNFRGDVKIELIGSIPSVIEASVANTGSYTWNIPEALAVGTDYKVMISGAADGNPMGESAAIFSITEKPFVLPNIVITEIMYTSPDASGKQEWVELYNNGTTSVDMEGFYILDADPLHKSDPIVLPAGAVLAPGEYYTIETSDDGKPELFPFVPDFKSIKFNFGKADEVKLFHVNGQLIDSVSYTNVSPWPTGTNGEGSSLTLCDPSKDNSLASSWEASLDEFTTLQSTIIKATPGTGCVLYTAVAPKLQSGITVYPNPTSDNLYISNPANEQLEITVLSSIGKPVKLMQANQGLTSVDLSDLPKGIYMVKMLNKNSKKIQMQKVVVR